ncbi:jg23817 [Pararge aegeria aegeria]|uniref:Jg23817 protein n=1 Tax=Pararge aegeria aegeria TaxID=348720 RepID=A0A8S4SNW8_9NEOP|nr:jg23817 [Pararge aegeria aegeria]
MVKIKAAIVTLQCSNTEWRPTGTCRTHVAATRDLKKRRVGDTSLHLLRCNGVNLVIRDMTNCVYGCQNLVFLAIDNDFFKYRNESNVTTRHAYGIRGVLHATLVAFDKQWNLALTDVLEIWKKKAPKKRKIPPGLGTPVPKGTAASISAVPVVTETPIGGGVLECTRHLPQVMVRGEHVVLVNIVER